MEKRFKNVFDKIKIKLFQAFLSKKGQTLVEYGIILVLIAVVVLLIVKGTGRQTNCIWSKINSGLNQ